MCVPPPPRENWIQEESENRELEEVPIETIEAQIRRLQRVLADRDAVVAARRRRLEEIRREAREAAAGAQNWFINERIFVMNIFRKIIGLVDN